MNLFTGMTDAQVKSAILAFLLFGFFVTLLALALAAFYVQSRPRRGRVRSAALLHIVAAVWFVMSLISTVWAAPAEKSFIDADNTANPGAFFAGARFEKVLIGLGFALVGILCMVAGSLVGRRQRQRFAEEAILEG